MGSLTAQPHNLGKPAIGRFSLFEYKLKESLLVPVILLVIGLGGAMFSVTHLTQPANLTVNSPAVSPASLQSATTPVLPRSTPERIRIPKIDLDSGVITTGLDSHGAIKMPDRFDVAAWYTGSPTPGQLGPSVIVGHVDQVGGIAIFWRVRELAPGDKIQIDRADASTANFRVLAVVQFPQNDFPTKKVYGNINYAGLRLITCSGTFNNATHHYDHNTVVYAKLVK